MRLSKEQIDKARNVRGAFSKKQIEYVKTLVGAGPKLMTRLSEVEVSQEQLHRLMSMASRKKKKRERVIPVVINAASPKHDGWSWKPERSDIPNLKTTGSTKNPKRQKETSEDRKSFYESKEWQELRYRVIRKYGGSCLACGRNYRDHKVIIHVDHIRPRSKFPSLALDFNNLQILCADCNVGKSNKDSTDWRPVVIPSDD
jgi:hypothetical protein